MARWELARRRAAIVALVVLSSVGLSACHELYCNFIEGLTGQRVDCSHDAFPDLGDIEVPPLPPPPSLPTTMGSTTTTFVTSTTSTTGPGPTSTVPPDTSTTVTSSAVDTTTSPPTTFPPTTFPPTTFPPTTFPPTTIPPGLSQLMSQFSVPDVPDVRRPSRR